MKKKKIFFISTELPFREGGSSTRNFNILKSLNKNKFSISLFTIIDEKSKKILPSVIDELSIPVYYVKKYSLSPLKQLFYLFTQKIIPYMKEYELSNIDDLLLKKVKEEKPDIIHIAQLNTYFAIQNIIPYLKKQNITIVLDQHNVENVAFSEGIQSMPFIKKLLGKILLPKLIQIEHKAIKIVDYIFVCSDIDKNYFKKFINLNKVILIPNGVDCNYFTTTTNPKRNTLLFMGGASYPPNNEALKYFFSKIHPKLQKQIKNYSIYILGANPSNWLINLSKKDSSIHLKGYVFDVREYIKKAKICICPIKSGSGTRIKILEYLASGKAVVSTRKGAEGIEIKNYKNILLSDSTSDFINNIVTLCNDNSKIKSLGGEGRKLILKQYQWKNIVKKIEYIYKS